MEAEFRTGRYFGSGLQALLRSGVWAWSTRAGLARCPVTPGGSGGRRDARSWMICFARELASSAASRGSALAAETSNREVFWNGRIRVFARRRSTQVSAGSVQRWGRSSASTTAWSWGRESPAAGSVTGLGLIEIRAVATKRNRDAARDWMAQIAAASPRARRADGSQAGNRNLGCDRVRGESAAAE